GWQTEDQWAALQDFLIRYDALTSPIDVTEAFTTEFLPGPFAFSVPGVVAALVGGVGRPPPARALRRGNGHAPRQITAQDLGGRPGTGDRPGTSLRLCIASWGIRRRP